MDPEATKQIVKERLSSIGIEKVKYFKHDGVGEIVPMHYEVKIGPETILFIYKPLEHHSYNIITINSNSVRIATLDTMLSLYLAFLYVKRPYYDSNRILCMSEFLFRVQEKNRLEQKGLLKRFSIDCYGTQATKESIRGEKSKKYNELKNKKNSKEWEWYFLNYKPGEKSSKNKTRKRKKNKTRKKKKKNKTKKGWLNKFKFR